MKRGDRVQTPLGPGRVINPNWGKLHDRSGHGKAWVSVELDRGGRRLYEGHQVRLLVEQEPA